MVDEEYTADDHEFRENDHYARAKYDITLRWLGAAQSRQLLNVGCGAGLFNELAHTAGFKVEACEPDPAAHAVAAAAAPKDVTVHLGGIFDAPITPGADLIVMHDVLEHIEDDAAAVTRMAELLAPDGRVVISVPAIQKLFGLHDEMLGHYRRYDRRSLTRVLEREFNVERTRYFGFAFIPVTAYFSRYRRRPYPTSSAGGTSIVGRAFETVCRAEARVPVPFGTSVLAVAARTRK